MLTWANLKNHTLSISPGSFHNSSRQLTLAALPRLLNGFASLGCTRETSMDQSPQRLGTGYAAHFGKAIDAGQFSGIETDGNSR